MKVVTQPPVYRENLLRAFDRVNDVTISSLQHVIGYKGELLRKNQGQQASTSSPYPWQPGRYFLVS